MIIRIICLFLVIFVSFTGCALYYPQTPDIPLISHKNDIRIDAWVSSMISANLTASYGLTNHLAIQAYGDIKDKFFYHGALGYYTHFGNNNILELYDGAGNGYGEAFNDARPGKLLGRYQLYFTQFNIGKIEYLGGHQDLGFGLKTGFMHARLTDKNYFFVND